MIQYKQKFNLWGVVVKVKKGLANKKEYSVSVEDVSLTLLVNERKNGPVSDFFQDVFHSHLYNELFVCINDEINIKTNNGIIQILKNDAVLIPSNIPHYNISKGSVENWYSLGFSIAKKTQKNSAEVYAKLETLFSDSEPKIFKNVPEICKKVAEINNTPYKTNDYLPALELVSILSKLNTAKSQNKTENANPQMRTQDIYRMAYFEDILQNRFYDPLTTSKLAETLNISPRQLSRIIKATYGKTFHEILTEKRLEYATDRLVTTNHSVTSILCEVGYARSSLFYKDFAEKFNMTPTEYRKKYSNPNNENS